MQTEQVLSSRGGGGNVLCLDGNIYLMNVIKLLMAMDNKAKEKHCLNFRL